MSNVASFQGGGVKGIAYIGAMIAFYEHNIKFDYFMGTSIGAVIASLLAVGYSPNELMSLVYRTDINELFNKNSFKSLVKQKGRYSVKPLEMYLNNLYKQKNKTLYRDIFHISDYRLKVVATKIKQMKKVVFPNDLYEYGYYPQLFPIARSVAMSCAYPLYFEPELLGTSLIVDGGLKENIPNLTFNIPNQKTFYFCVSKPKFKKYPNMILINTKSVSFLDTNLTNKQKQTLIQNGYIAAKQFCTTNLTK